MDSSKRINYIGNLRIFACIGVILCHVAANNWYGNIEENSWLVMTTYVALSKFCVPAFIMISGVLFLQNDKEVSVKKLYLHNILRLVIFLVFWSECYQVYNLVVYENESYIKAIVRGFINILQGNTQAHFWYIYLIIGLYMIVPIVKPWINQLNRRQIEYFLLLFLIFNSMYCIVSGMDYWICSLISEFCGKLSINIVGGFLGYFVLGYYLNTYDITPVVRKVLYCVGGIAVILCIMCTVIYSRHIGIPVELFWNYCGIFVVLWSTSVFVFFKYNLNRVLGNWWNKIEDCTFGIYACHVFFMSELWRRGIDIYIFGCVISIPVIVIMTFACSLVFVYFIRKIPLAKKWIV